MYLLNTSLALISAELSCKFYFYSDYFSSPDSTYVYYRSSLVVVVVVEPTYGCEASRMAMQRVTHVRVLCNTAIAYTTINLRRKKSGQMRGDNKNTSSTAPCKPPCTLSACEASRAAVQRPRASAARLGRHRVARCPLRGATW